MLAVDYRSSYLSLPLSRIALRSVEFLLRLSRSNDWKARGFDLSGLRVNQDLLLPDYHGREGVRVKHQG
jgi:hypothetical protein